MNRRIALLLLSFALLGCSHEEPLVAPDVPASAIDVKEGVGRLFFQATSVGTIYLYDADTATVLLEQPIEPPQRFILDPRAGSVTIEGKTTFADPSRFEIKIGDHTIQELPIDQKHTHRIYFVPGQAHGPATRP